MTLDITGNTVIGQMATGSSSSGYGLRVYTSNQKGLVATIENNTIKAIGRGIYFYSQQASRAVIKSNTIDSTYYQGVYLNKVSGRIESNTITKCGRYDYFGIDITSDFNYPAIDTLQYNTITGNGYWQSPSNTSSSGGWGGIRLDGYTQAKINYNNIYMRTFKRNYCHGRTASNSNII